MNQFFILFCKIKCLKNIYQRFKQEIYMPLTVHTLTKKNKRKRVWILRPFFFLKKHSFYQATNNSLKFFPQSDNEHSVSSAAFLKTTKDFFFSNINKI